MSGPWFGVVAWSLKDDSQDPVILSMFNTRPEAVQSSANYSASGARSIVVRIVDDQEGPPKTTPTLAEQMIELKAKGTSDCNRQGGTR